VSRLKAESRIVLQACHDSLQRDAAGFVADSELAEATGLNLSQVRDCLESLNGNSFVDLARVGESYRAMATAEGRLELRRPRPFAETADIRMTVQRAGRLLRAGRFQKAVGLAVTLMPVVIGLTIVAIAIFTAYKILMIPKAPTVIAMMPKTVVPKDEYDPCAPNVRGRDLPCDRLLPIKLAVQGLLQMGHEVVVVIESKPFEKEYPKFKASIVLASVPRAMKPLCAVFLVREETAGATSLISLGCNLMGVSSDDDVYRKLTFTVPESRSGERLIVLTGLSQASYEAARAFEKSSESQGRVAFSIDVETL
jgi:hypothetical protein